MVRKLANLDVCRSHIFGKLSRSACMISIFTLCCDMKLVLTKFPWFISCFDGPRVPRHD